MRDCVSVHYTGVAGVFSASVHSAAPTGGRSPLEKILGEIPRLRFDCVDRGKLDFFNAAKLLLLGHVAAKR